MHNKNTDFPGVRLLVAGCLCLVLLVWTGFFDDSWQNAFARLGLSSPHGTDSLGALITAVISFFIVAIIFPVAYRGRTSDRWLVAILAIIPFSVLFLTALGLLSTMSIRI